MKKCPYCAEDIREDAIKCKHCGEWLNKPTSYGQHDDAKDSTQIDKRQQGETDQEHFDRVITPLLNNPEILPCDADPTIEFWQKRISLWGKLTIKYKNPNKHGWQIITPDQSLKILTDPMLIDVFGTWATKKINVTTCEFFRKFVDTDKKRKIEIIRYEIKLPKGVL